MATRSKAASTGRPGIGSSTRHADCASINQQVEDAVDALQKLATQQTLDGYARYAIPADNALGVSMTDIQKLGKRIGRHHDLALALWQTDLYEARMLCAFIDDPLRVTSVQMDRWCRDFDNWAICDTLCFKLFDQTPHAWAKVPQWAGKKDEFVKRAGFALLASLAGHDKTADDAQFIATLPLIEKAANDDRNFVWKGVSWALRRIGTRKSPKLKVAAKELAQRLAGSTDATARRIGKEALREFGKKI